jgi:hypothetical protein
MPPCSTSRLVTGTLWYPPPPPPCAGALLMPQQQPQQCLTGFGLQGAGTDLLAVLSALQQLQDEQHSSQCLNSSFWKAVTQCVRVTARLARADQRPRVASTCWSLQYIHQ